MSVYTLYRCYEKLISGWSRDNRERERKEGSTKCIVCLSNICGHTTITVTGKSPSKKCSESHHITGKSPLPAVKDSFSTCKAPPPPLVCIAVLNRVNSVQVHDTLTELHMYPASTNGHNNSILNPQVQGGSLTS